MKRFLLILFATSLFCSIGTKAGDLLLSPKENKDLHFAPPVLTRGPYLQSGKQDSITIRWRTDIASDSRVTWGTAFGTYPNTLDLPALTTEHIVRIGGLTADIKYWYTIGSTTLILQATNTNYFLTLPRYNSTRKLRFLALGDCGTSSAVQTAVKNTFINYIGATDIDAMLTFGDNAYSTGLDAEFQTGFFDMYKNDFLKYYKLYTAPGNHDYGNTTANTGSRTMPYHLNFSNPRGGELGGVASGVSNYYSYDIADVHFISLDSYGKDDANTTSMYDTLGAQATWLKADLTANTKKWVIAYFHHPPYTKTSHTSDTELDLVAVREKFVRILERFGVDLILCGHAHGYERSYLLKNFYRTYANPFMDSSFKFIYHTALGTNQNAKYDGTANSCSYNYNSGKYNHGSVYIVAGSSGQVGGSQTGYPQDCMYYSNITNGGCLYFEIDSNRLDMKFISYTTAPTPVIRDQFTIFKDVNKVQNINIVKNTPLVLTASWRGSYLWPNNGSVTTQAVTINTASVGTFNYTVRDANSCLKDSFHVVVTVPLPVSITSFAATLNKDIVLLDWSTSQESNNKFFTIEKSTDGSSFSFLGNVNGAGNSSTTKKYHLNDLQPADGINYYRLSQTDMDGQRRSIEVKKVIYKSIKDFRATIVNTGGGALNIAIHNASAGLVNMKVVDMMGREVLKETFNSASGDITHTIQLNKGTYVLMLVNSTGQTINTKIIAD
ncbi:MAG: metallophosphoesterase [Ferruginibacter sp.]